MNIIVGITGGIAAYKAPLIVRLLKRAGHEVKCVATESALQFVTLLTLETVSQNKVYHSLFDAGNDHTTEHISLKDWGDMMVVAPATANIIGKLASGIGDDALSTLLLSFRKPLYIAPAMNTQMLECPSVVRNMDYLRSIGVRFIELGEGELACGATGKGRMADPDEIVREMTLSTPHTSNSLHSPLSTLHSNKSAYYRWSHLRAYRRCAVHRQLLHRQDGVCFGGSLGGERRKSDAGGGSYASLHQPSLGGTYRCGKRP